MKSTSRGLRSNGSAQWVCKGALGALAMLCLGGAAPVGSAPDDAADEEACEVIIDEDGGELLDCGYETTVNGTSTPPPGAEFMWWASFGTGWSLFAPTGTAPTPAERTLERGLDRMEEEADRVREQCITAAVRIKIDALAAVEAMRAEQIAAEDAAYQALWAAEDQSYRDQLDGCGDYAPCITTVTESHIEETDALNANHDLGMKLARDTAAEGVKAATDAANEAIKTCEESGI